MYAKNSEPLTTQCNQYFVRTVQNRKLNYMSSQYRNFTGYLKMQQYLVLWKFCYVYAKLRFPWLAMKRDVQWIWRCTIAEKVLISHGNLQYSSLNEVKRGYCTRIFFSNEGTVYMCSDTKGLHILFCRNSPEKENYSTISETEPLISDHWILSALWQADKDCLSKRLHMQHGELPLTKW